MRIFFILFACITSVHMLAQVSNYDANRPLRYRPEGNDIVNVSGTRKFNRAIYGTNTAFRIEAGDLPEFALYMPGMGGNLKIGLQRGDHSIWISKAKQIKSIYRPGAMIYEIRDPLMDNGVLYVHLLAMADREGMIVKITANACPTDASLVWVFGGATGKKFSRDGDIGADPESSFYLKPENCKDNRFNIQKSQFVLQYGSGKVLSEEARYEIDHLSNLKNSAAIEKSKYLYGQSVGAQLKVVNAAQQKDPNQQWNAVADSTPALAGKWTTIGKAHYLLISPQQNNDSDAATLWEAAELKRKQLANRIIVETPDPYINTLGGVLSVAADAIWEDPSYLHGAVAWRMRLNAWRGAYVANPLGWHDRAEKHFTSYEKSQVTLPPIKGLVADTALHLARQWEQLGTAMFSDGYISRNPNGDQRAHHYDMNLVFIDQLLRHFQWTGDTALLRKMWPLLNRHLAWEKRNFDADGDGLYDAYAAIWASDALQYSGGGVTHSTAYNYYANAMMASLAKVLGVPTDAYETEMQHIQKAVNDQLWLKDQGWYAEYKDLLGKKSVHTAPAIWTIYHALDELLASPFQAYSSLRYIDQHIPHIRIKTPELSLQNMFLVGTSNWQPYTWSINNVALSENMHMALAYWQGGVQDTAYNLWRSTLIESMYLGAGPGNLQQISFYDAYRGVLYRDFADGIGMTGRTLVEGLFGIQPDLMHHKITIQPGFPSTWDHASLKTPDIDFYWKRQGMTEEYKIYSHFGKKLRLTLKIPARVDQLPEVRMGGKILSVSVDSSQVGSPYILVDVPLNGPSTLIVHWKGQPLQTQPIHVVGQVNQSLQINFPYPLVTIRDEPSILQLNAMSLSNDLKQLKIIGKNRPGKYILYALLRAGAMKWWMPIELELLAPWKTPMVSTSAAGNYQTVDLSKTFNAKVTDIFQQQYLSPRAQSPTLQLPTQGIGNWCYPLVTAQIDDRGLREKARMGAVKTMTGVPFQTPSTIAEKNIGYTSLWDNYPATIQVPVHASAANIHLLMAGSTNPMQSRFENGAVIALYEDGEEDTLLLKNPENWWPIEQDYYVDGVCYTTDAPWPERLYLKEGVFSDKGSVYTTIKGFTTRAIDGGAATVLHFPARADKVIQSIRVETWANDVVIGLMAITLEK